MITDRINEENIEDNKLEELESLNDIQKRTWGGARKGAGRVKHSKNKATIDREEAARQFKERVAKHVDKLFNSQMDLAVGEKYLMVKTTTGTGKNRKTTVEIVTDPELIKDYIDSGESYTFGEENEYYFMTTKAANNMALDSLLNRSFGKAAEKLDITTGGDKISGEMNPELAEKFTAFLKQSTKD